MNACVYPRIAARFQADRVACDRGDDGACNRMVNQLRDDNQRSEIEERCEAGYTRGCLMLADYYLVIEPDADKVAEYQALAESQLASAPRK
jgi:hypothetical protein